MDTVRVTGVFTIAFHFYNLLYTHNILLKQFSFYLSYTYFFLSNQDQAPALKIAYIFKVFGAQSCLIVAQQFDQTIYVYEECNNFQDSKLIFMIIDFKVFPIMLLRWLIVVYCSFNSYFAFITKEKLHFSCLGIHFFSFFSISNSWRGARKTCS